MNEAKLGETLIRLGAINALHLAKAAQHQKKNGGSLSNALIETGAVTAEELARIAATLLKLPYVSLRTVSVPPEMVRLLPPEVAKRFNAIVLKAQGKTFWVAMSQPTNIEAIDALRFRLGGTVIPVVTPELDLERALEFYYGKLKNTPLNLPSSATREYPPETFDIKKARAASGSTAPRPATSTAAASTPSVAIPTAPVTQRQPSAPVSPPPPAPVAAVAPPQQEEVLDLTPTPEVETGPAASVPPSANGSDAKPVDDDLIKELANFLLGK